MRAWEMRHLAVIGAAVALALPGCGGDDGFTAQEFVDRVNDEGVAMQLGDELFTDEEGERVYGIELEPVARLPGQEASHSGGSLSVHDDGEGATRQMESCEASADLLCYRASNVVVVLEGGGIEAQQLAVAMGRLEE
jgi:hypothetical protein